MGGIVLRRVRKGFTILEVSIVAVLLSILLLILLRWIGGLSAAGSAGVNASTSSRELTFSLEQIRRDISRAEGCDPMGLDVPIHSIKANEIAIYLPDGSGGSELAIWRVSDLNTPNVYYLERATVTDSGGCVFDLTSAEFELVLENVLYDSESPLNPVFSVLASGIAVTDDTVYKDCYLDYDQCLFNKIMISLSIVGAGGTGTVAQSSAVGELNLTGSRLVLLSDQ
jgi:prepilin-type N-terminal cleavage/methylation domain-containing protein